MDLEAYLARLALAPPLSPSLDTLQRLHVAHLAAFPFHNLEIQRGGTVRVDVDSIAQKFLGPDGGGYCFEHNTLFGEALRRLGFAVTTLLARVGPPERPLNHMLLRVDVEGRPWLADVGFGGETLLEPMPLEDGARATQQGIDYSLRFDAPRWTLGMRCGDVQEEMYSFIDVGFSAADVEMANFYTSMHPQSIFRRSLTIQRITAEERIMLRPTVVMRVRGGVREEITIEPAQLRRYARELFGIELGDAPLLFESG